MTTSLPRIIEHPQQYVTRGGEIVFVVAVYQGYARGYYEGKPLVIDEWDVNGLSLPYTGGESLNDIVRKKD